MGKSKKELRQSMKDLLATLSENEVAIGSIRIANTLFMTDKWKSSRIIGITVSRGREINTRRIIEKAWAEGKEVAIPKCFPEEKKMVFFIFTSFNQLEEVYFGLHEPIVSETRQVEHSNINLLIVPGVCFTERGYRIGYGGGYFDRYLAQYNRDTVSLLYECQLLQDLPVESFDLPVQQLITDKRNIVCNG